MNADKKEACPYLRSSAFICGFYCISLAIIALAAIVTVLLATNRGIGTSSDSARYVRAARQLLGREADVVLPIEAPAQRAHYPPLYSTVLAMVSVGGADPLSTARWLHGILLALNAILTAELVRRFTGGQAAALFSAAMMAFSPGMLGVHTFALSEPLAIWFSLATLGLLAANGSNPGLRNLIFAGLLTAAAMLTRYAGVALLLAGASVIALGTRGRSRPAGMIAYCVTASVIPIGWIVYNMIAHGSATNRVLAWHPVSTRHLVDVAQVTWNWLGGDAPVHPVLTFLAALLALLVLIAGVVWTRNALTSAMAIYIVASGVVLALSISLLDFHTPLDIRVLSPVYAAWVVLLGVVLAKAQASAARLRVPIVLMAAVMFAWAGMRSFAQVIESHRDGAGFAHRRWRASPTLAALRSVPMDKWIYSNAPGAVYLLTGRTIVISVPSPYSASSRLPNPDFDAEMERMRGDLHSGRAILVYLDRPASRQWYALTEAQLKKRFGLHPIFRRSNDGGIYDFVPPASTQPSTQATPQ